MQDSKRDGPPTEIVVAATIETYGMALDKEMIRAAVEIAADLGVRLGSYIGVTDHTPHLVLHHWRVNTTTYEVTDSPKSLRETLCRAQTAIGAVYGKHGDAHIERLQRLINECDRHRPLGPDGTHGDRHTPTCGCEDA